jgi:DNA-binding transcriptional regulator of glucitol operon
MLGEYTWIILALAVAWVIQLALSLWQIRRFYARFNELRRAGTSAIGTAGSIYGGRVYVVLVADEEHRVVHAEKLAGWTVFAQLRPVEVLHGRTLSEILAGEIEGLSKKVRQAFRKAAEDILAAEQKDTESAASTGTPSTDVVEDHGKEDV